MAKFVNSACCWGIRGWHTLRSSEGSASSLLRCLVISDHLRAGSRFQDFVFSHITQHSIQNITKQNNRHILNISKSSQEGGREGRTIKTQSHSFYTITYIKQKTLPSINGRRPGPTDSRRCTFTSHYLQEATDPICFSTDVRCKQVLYYCLLRSCKTSKQHSLLHGTYTETRIIIKKTQTWVSKPINL